MVAWHKACNESQSRPWCYQVLVQVQSLFCHSQLHALFTCHLHVSLCWSLVEIIVNHWKKNNNVSLGELSVCWWVGDERTVAGSLCSGHPRREPPTLPTIRSAPHTDGGVLWLFCYCLILKTSTTVLVVPASDNRAVVPNKKRTKQPQSRSR